MVLSIYPDDSFVLKVCGQITTVEKMRSWCDASRLKHFSMCCNCTLCCQISQISWSYDWPMKVQCTVSSVWRRLCFHHTRIFLCSKLSNECDRNLHDLILHPQALKWFFEGMLQYLMWLQDYQNNKKCAFYVMVRGWMWIVCFRGIARTHGKGVQSLVWRRRGCCIKPF